MLAKRQHGVVSRGQLLELGLSSSAIGRLVADGRLEAVHRGVYAVAGHALRAEGRWMAAVLACGAGAVLSHRSAAQLWGVVRGGGARVDVTVPARGRGPRRWIVVHQVRALHVHDLAVKDGIPVTTLHRTLLDLAGVVHPQRLADALETAERLRLLDVRELEATCARNPGRRGLNPISAWLSEHHRAPEETRSELERRFLRMCDEAGLPRPAMNVAVAGFDVDALWPDERLVVELDGYEFHRGRGAFERDRVRDAHLQLAGYRVLRVTARRLENGAAADVRALLS